MPHFVSELAYMVGYLSNRKELQKLIPITLDEAPVEGQIGKFDPIQLDTADVEQAAVEIDKRIHRVQGILAAQSETIEEKRAQVKKSAATYIESTQMALRERENHFKQWADTWYMISYVSLGGALGLSIWKGAGVISITSGFSLTGYLLANLVTAVLFIAISKLAFTLAKGYMVESLRNADRSHAISFGEFYLNAFEEKIEWSEVKDVFQHWNIDRGSSFTSQEATQFDPKLLETALEIAKVLKAQKTP